MARGLVARGRTLLPPSRLIAAYALDWLLIICILAVAGGISFATPYHHPFSLLDLTISFPYVADDLISTPVLVVVSLIAPAVIIVLVVAIITPHPGARRHMDAATFWKVKLWEWNAGWMGLLLSFALALFVTSGIKNIFGRPRPDLLSRCQPDLTNLADHVVGGYGQDISARWTLVSSSICQQQDMDILNDGFRSFLSGHSSSSWSGLLYLSLWLAVKFNITMPYLHHRVNIGSEDSRDPREEIELLPLHTTTQRHSQENFKPNIFSDQRRQGAAPPVFGHIIVLIPIAVATYICSTRWVDFKHHGTDILSGSIVGIVSALIGFRCYHSSLTGPHAFTWGPRHKNQAFAVSTGARGWTTPKNETRTIRQTNNVRESADVSAYTHTTDPDASK